MGATVARVDWSTVSQDVYSEAMRMFVRSMTYGIDNDLILGGLLTTGVVQGLYSQSVTQNYVLGTKRICPDGREFRYAKAGGTGLGLALMCQSAVFEAKYIEQVQTAYGILAGATSGTVLITTGATPVADVWKDGYLVVNKGTGLGNMYRITGNTSHATLPVITFAHALSADIPAASEVSIIPNQFMGTVVCPVTTLTARPIGIPPIAVTANYYYWSQVRGPAPITVDTGDTLVIGEPCGAAGTNAVAGAAGIATTTEGHYGRVLYIATAAEIAVVDLALGL